MMDSKCQHSQQWHAFNCLMCTQREMGALLVSIDHWPSVACPIGTDRPREFAHRPTAGFAAARRCLWFYSFNYILSILIKRIWRRRRWWWWWTWRSIQKIKKTIRQWAIPGR